MQNYYDIILIGAGLSNTLLIYQLKLKMSQLDFIILEKNKGDSCAQTWSFHEEDVIDHPWIHQFSDYTWQGHDVYFPSYHRTLKSQYSTIKSSSFFTKIKKILGTDQIIYNQEVISLSEEVNQLNQPIQKVKLSNGTVLHAKIVIDGRGLSSPPTYPTGHQKFLGMELELSQPHHLKRPILKDARVTQDGGYHFIYVLPWNTHQLLIEDTYYTLDPLLHKPSMIMNIENYLKEKNWIVSKIMGEEYGVLPIPLTSNLFQDKVETSCWPYPIEIGIKGGFFHFVTGYSLPSALDMAQILTTQINLMLSLPHPHPQKELSLFLNHLRKKEKFKNVYFAFLNRMLFLAAKPNQSYKILERFYRFPEPFIGRFYAGKLSYFDYARLMMGKPPVPILSALRRGLFK